MLSAHSWRQASDNYLPSGRKSPPQPEAPTESEKTFTGPESSRIGCVAGQHPKGWPVHQGFSTPQQLSMTDVRRPHSRTTYTTVRAHTEINGAAAELCGAAIRVVYSALIDEVQKMLQ